MSPSVESDCYQLWLEAEESDAEETDSHQATGPYLIVWRDFEMPDGGERYIETHDRDYIGHFRLRLTELSHTHLAFEIGRNNNNRVEISFALNASDFAEVRRVADVIFGLREPDPDEDEL